MNKMKQVVKHFAYALVASVAVLVGCQSVPTPEYIGSLSTAIGVSTGMVVNMTKIDDASRNAIVDIMNKVSQCIPETNQSFEAAWTPIAKEHTQKLIDEGKIDAKQGDLILTAFSLVTKGIDYLFDVRFPKAKEYKELVTAGVDGFINGFLTMFKPANGTLCAGKADYDKDALDYLLEEGAGK